jgi:hypothetical protein
MLFQNPFTSGNQQTQQPANDNQQVNNANQQFTQNPNANPQGQQNFIIPNNEPPQGNTQNNNQQTGNTLNPQANPKGQDPLSDFTKLWENDVVDPNNPQPGQVSTYLPNLDPAKLNQMVGQLDFTRNITPEQKAALAGGGENAVQAMMDVVNMATRSAFLMGFQGTHKMVETGLGNAKNAFVGEIPNYVKEQMSIDGLTTSNPIMSDPAYGKLVDDVRRQIQVKNPKATPTQVQQAVNRYFDDMVGTLTKAKSQNTQQDGNQNDLKLKQGAADADWEGWFSEAAGLKQ